jgi:predicted transcriptional regulator
MNMPDEESAGLMLDKIKEDISLASRHIEVLITVASHQPIGIIKLSELLKVPQHRIRYSLRILETSGYIQASSAGAIATTKAEELFFHLNDDIDEIVIILQKIKGMGLSPT